MVQKLKPDYEQMDSVTLWGFSLVCFCFLQVEIYGDGTRAPLTLRDWALVDYDYIWQQGVTYSISHCIAETYDQLKQTVDK